MMRIFQIVPYPIDQPLHGGQIRAAEINKRLRAIGATVRYTVVCLESQYNVPLDHSIHIPSRSPWIDPDFPYLADYFAGVHLANDAISFKQLSQELSAFRPTMIWVDQLWAWSAVRRWIAETGNTCQVCYSSQNIEYDLKRQMHATSGKWWTDEADPARLIEYLEEIKKIEEDFAKSADLCLAVSESDAAALRGMGAARVIVVPNGATRRIVDQRRLQDWRHFFGKRRYVAFIGSGHPPNVIGFWDCIGGKIGFLRPDEFILAVGGVCSLLREGPQFKALGALAVSRIQLAGVVSEVDLAALLAGACGIILPIRTGGGSNLKTAEALATGKPIVTTSTALRGFDFARTLSNVVVADDDRVFRANIRRLLDTADAATPELTATDQQQREALFWDHCLAGITIAALEECAK